MRPIEVFEVVHERYQECKRLTVKLGAINPSASTKQMTQRAPNITKVMAFCLDFELCGKRVLAGHPRRLMMFEFYFCGGSEMKQVTKALKIGESTFWYWSKVIKRDVGRDLRKRGLFPPTRYFKELADVTITRKTQVTL